ncbi:MAG: thiolase family protein [Verrucomicrobia bacterium]|nr:thiolase family protein [Verrucomicrobiota bacterium]MDA1085890.1 thiolase family protein [Verrucomicrobiota bacterium]
MKERLAIIDGIRTPQCRAGGVLRGFGADDLGAIAVRELMLRTAYPESDVDELILGNVAQPVHAANIARVVALKAGLPTHLIAHTVHRNCASGMQAISSAANKIFSGEAEVMIAAGTESMSNIPLLYGPQMTKLFASLARAKTLGQRLKALSSFRFSFLKPIVGLEKGLTDPVCGMIMGLTAEVLAREFQIPREEQDAFALLSHQRAAAARDAGRLAEEIVPLPVAPRYERVQEHDDGIRDDQTLEALAKLRPYFDRQTGTVTVGNACSITDGAAALLVMSESRAKSEGLEPLGYVRDYAYAALEGNRMGLGPVYATSKLLAKSGMKMKDFKLVEINEAFAVQVLACLRAFESKEFAKQYLDRKTAPGAVDPELLNVNGGAVALGHPVGATGTRLVLTVLKELRRRNQNCGLATLCVGGGQGAAFALEVT